MGVHTANQEDTIENVSYYNKKLSKLTWEMKTDSLCLNVLYKFTQHVSCYSRQHSQSYSTENYLQVTSFKTASLKLKELIKRKRLDLLIRKKKNNLS